ncbi:MAG: hypothetical protein ACRYFW_03800 [Janthinobacterium lividum]
MAQYAAMIFQAFEIPQEAKPVVFSGFELASGPPTTGTASCSVSTSW